jgi:hypothetical protein
MTRETEIFLGLARVETFRRDVNRMDKAVRIDLESADAITELQAAWDKLRPWLDCINPNPQPPL